MLPDRRAVEFARWYRRAVRSGRLTGAEARIHGDPRRIPFPKGDGEFRATGTVRGIDFAYAEGWPAVRIEEAEVRAEGAGLGFSGVRGSILDSAIEDGAARLRDVTDQAGRVQVSLAGSGPARDLLAFIRASPLRTQDGGPAPDLRADGPASTTAELDVPYGRGAAGRKIGVSGTIALDGVALRLAGRRAVLEGVAGDLAFDAATLRGGPLRGRLRGAEVESHVEFDRDEGLRLRFSGEGDGDWFGAALEDLVDLGPEETGPWLEHVQGRVSWDAEYRSRAGIVFRSDLRTASIDFPPPFEKPAGTARALEVALTPRRDRVADRRKLWRRRESAVRDRGHGRRLGPREGRTDPRGVSARPCPPRATSKSRARSPSSISTGGSPRGRRGLPGRAAGCPASERSRSRPPARA